MTPNSTEDMRPGSPLPADRGISPRLRGRLFVDACARRGVTLGGWCIIGAIFAILFVIVAEFYPLFKTPTARLEATFTTATRGEVFAVGADEYREVSYLIDSAGIHFYSLKDNKPLPDQSLNALGTARIIGVSLAEPRFPVLGLSDGRALPVRVEFEIEYRGGVRTIRPVLAPEEALMLGGPEGLARLTHRQDNSGYTIAAATGPKTVEVARVRVKKNLMGKVTRRESRQSLAFPAEGSITALALDVVREGLLVGSGSGQILWARIDGEGDTKTLGATREANLSIAQMGFLLGDYTLVLTDSSGGVSSYHFPSSQEGGPSVNKIYDFEPDPAGIGIFSHSMRDKGFLTGGGSALHIHYGTSGATQLTLSHPGGKSFRAAVLTPKSDGVVAADEAGHLFHWTLDNPYPEVSFAALFGKVRYEGYEKGDYVWQSTGGSDAFETKLSLTPLIFGTLKGTLYALLFALPLALCGAFYTSQFMRPRLKAIVKPVLEIMAALPSVVLGFFAALFIAPNVETYFPALAVSPLVVVMLVFVGLGVYELVPAVKKRLREGNEIYALIPLTLVGAFLAFSLGGVVESAFLEGDYRGWLKEMLDITYDQRNALVVGLAMGFAVIPIIFTLSEDSLSNVPEHLRASSLALGATPWQTALRVILPTASPGIFSAIMIGLGRAVGETMIVLMATGNTPVMEWSLFNGFRALSANIAVELPEAPEGGTLFRVLFLAAFLLFVMTFLVNTLAEVVRLRLRKRYQAQ
jgi:phosphate transport system permease protein